MKKTCMAACLAISLGFCSTAMAKDVDAIDVFAANSLTAIAYWDISSLVNNKMLSDLYKDDDGASAGLETLAKLGIDYKKDIKGVVAAFDLEMRYCCVVDASKSLKSAWDKELADASNLSTYGSYQIASTEDVNAVLLSDKRMLVCGNGFDIHTVLDNVAKPKSLKNTDKVLYTAYSQTSAKADVRVAGKMVPTLRKDLASARLSYGDIVVSAADAEALSVSIDLKKGAVIDARVLGKSDKIAADAATILNKQIAPILSDPSLGEMGLGFLPSVLKIGSSAKYLTVNVDMNKDQVATIVALLTAMQGGMK